MQGHSGRIGSLSETLEIDHASSSSSNVLISNQLRWDAARNPSESQLSHVMVPPNDRIAFMNSVNNERQNLHGHSFGEPHSHSSHYEVNGTEWKAEHGWLPSVGFSGGSGPCFGDQQWAANTGSTLTNNLTSNPVMIQGSSSSWIAPNLNLIPDHGCDGSPFVESPRYSLAAMENQQVPPVSSSNPFMMTSGNGECLVAGTDGGLGCPSDVRRIPCKRKSLEGHVGQSSNSENSLFIEDEESSTWHATSACNNVSSNSTVSPTSEHTNPQLQLSVIQAGGLVSRDPPHSSVLEGAETLQRNYRPRVMDTNPNSFTSHHTAGTLANSSITSTSQFSNYISGNGLVDFPATSSSSDVNGQEQPMLHVPALPNPRQSVRWSAGSISRSGSSSRSVFSGNRDTVRGASSVRNSRNILGHPMYVPPAELPVQVPDPVTADLTGGSGAVPGNATYSSEPGSSSSAPQLPQPNWVPNRSRQSQYPRRLSEYVRRSLLASIGSETDQSNHSLHNSGHPVLSQDSALSSGSRNGGHRQSLSRSAPWMERHADGMPGLPYSMRTLAAASEGRRRLVLEIRSALDHMRRGDGIQFEDVMILDHAAFFGAADIHDRHRDMRLDVDNMSYEELLALEERIGNVSTGLNEETVEARMKQHKYTATVDTNMEAEPCCVCQEVYNEGDNVGTLDCGHDFHTDCIKQWLLRKNLCPICKTTGLTT